jgi:imidazolonepropionase-like amidohydrolase
LGREHDLGSLEPGKKADLLFIPMVAHEDFWPALLDSGAQGNISWISGPNGEAVHER